MSNITIQARVIRLRDAPLYLGMKKDQFNRGVRPTLETISIGIRGIGFDRLDLDAWVDHHKSSKVGSTLYRGDKVWQQENHQDSSNEEVSGELTKSCSEDVFAKALALVNSKRRKST